MCTILGYGLPEREICDILLLSFIQTKWNQLSTDFVGPPFFQERSIVSHAFLFLAFLFLRFRKVEEVQHIIFIPSDSHSGFYFPPPAKGWRSAHSLQRGKYVISFYFPLFKQSGINYPPTSSVPLSFKKGASFLMLSFNQLSHACPLQEEDIWYPGSY